VGGRWMGEYKKKGMNCIKEKKIYVKLPSKDKMYKCV
jgi:hypothetical protein